MDYDQRIMERRNAHQAWRLVLGGKIICSGCKTKGRKNFTFRWNTEQNRMVIITCKVCDHSGNYNADEHTMKLFVRTMNMKIEMAKKKEGNYALEA